MLSFEAVHQPRGIHVAVAGADAGLRHAVAKGLRGDSGDVEAEGRDTVVEPRLVADAVDDRPVGVQHFQHLPRQRLLVGADGGHARHDVLPARIGGSGRHAAADALEVFYRRAHPRDVLVDEGPGLDLVGRLVGNEILAKRRQPLQGLVLAPQEAHVRRKILVAGADQIVAVPFLHVDQAVRAEMDAVDEDLGAGFVREPRGGRDVDDRADGMGGLGAGDEARPVRQQRPEVVGVEVAVLAHAPPDEFRAGLLQREPGGDVGVVVHVGDHDLVALLEHLPDAEAHQADERGRIHAEADFGGIRRVDQRGDAFARFRDARVDGAALVVASAALDVVLDQVMGDRVQHRLRDLRSGRIVEEDEGAGALQSRELSPHRLDGKGPVGGKCGCGLVLGQMSLRFIGRSRPSAA